MQVSTQSQVAVKPLWMSAAIALAGSAFIALMSQLAVPVPFSPVPLSMQVVAVLMLAGTMGSRLALASVVTYLCEAMMGLPVLAGWKSMPMIWMLPTFGYLLGFVAAAWTVGRLLEQRPTGGVIYCTLCCLSGCVIILCSGGLWLAPLMGIKAAVVAGILPFIVADCIKAVAVASLLRGLRPVRIALVRR